MEERAKSQDGGAKILSISIIKFDKLQFLIIFFNLDVANVIYCGMSRIYFAF